MKQFLVGALIGAGVALLCAPATGKSTRSAIRDKAIGMGGDVSDFVDKKSRHLMNKMEGVKHTANGLMQKMPRMSRTPSEFSEPTPSI